MSYGGESNAKRIARAQTWCFMLKLLGYAKPPEELRALVLAGPCAGDIQALHAFGVPPENVTAVDTDADAIRSSMVIEPNADYRHGDILKVVTAKGRKRKNRKPPKRYDLIFLDYCSPISDRAVRKSVRVAKAALVNGGIFCTGFMYGRESHGARDGVKLGRVISEEAARMMEAGELVETPALLRGWQRKGIDPKELRSEIPEMTGKVKAAARSALSITSRVHLLQCSMMRFSVEQRMILFNVGHVAYRSGRRSDSGRSVGVPMLYYMAKGLQFLGTPSHRKLSRHYYRATEQFDSEDTYYVEHFPDDPDGEHIRRLAIALAEARGSRLAAQVLNLKTQQVAAWLAWKTRNEAAA